MPYRLAPNLHYSFVDDQAVMLDVNRDRYSLLGHHATRGLRDWHDRQASPEAMERLRALGILEPGISEPAAATLPPVMRSALELDRRNTRSPSFSVATAFLIRSLLGLRLRGLASTLGEARGRTGAGIPNPEDLVGFAQAFARHRSRLPLRHICLPDSLALHHFLFGRGLKASVVIGVRLNPFAAHCWVQAEDLVLNDSCDGVSRFTPIMIL
jgi:hypothetical protein